MPAGLPRTLVPRTLAEALELCRENADATAVSGATIVLQPEMPASTVRIDLGALPFAAVQVTDDGALDIGALVRLGDLARLPALADDRLGALRDVLDAFVPRAVRALATVGGNLAFGGALGGPLALLGAQVKVQSLAGGRTVAADALALAPGELVVGAIVPLPPPFVRTCAAIVRKTPVGPGLVSVAVGVAGGAVDVVVSGGYTRTLRIAIPSTATPADLQRAVQDAVLAAAPHGGMSGDGPWRSAVAGVVARRLFTGTWQRPVTPTHAGTAPDFDPRPADGVFSFHARVDGQAVAALVPADATLTDALRLCGAFQVKSSCSEGACGACSVLVDGHTMRSCLVPATRCNGLSIRTAAAPEQQELGEAIAKAGGLQCGFCTPGMVAALASLAPPAEPWDAAALARELDGNLCRCTGYVQLLHGAVEALNARRNRAG
jgi:carbon-monoxide dehydrogenase small subunit